MSAEPETGPVGTGGSPEQATAGHKAEPGRALVHFVAPKAGANFAFRPRHALWLAGLLFACGAGAAGLEGVRYFGAAPEQKQAAIDPTAQLVHRLQDEVGRLKGSVDTLRTTADSKQDESIRGLKKSVESLRQEIEQTRSTDGATLAQLSTKIDKTDHDPGQKLAEIMARLEKLDRDPKEKTSDAGAAQKLADVATRLERIERQVSSPASTGSIPPAAKSPVRVPVSRIASVAPAATTVAVATPSPRPAQKSEASDVKIAAARPTTIDGWVVRDVYNGMALVEGRGGLREIAPGEFLPGAGEVHAIQRRGGSWVVLTDRGVIGNSTW